MGRPDSSEKGWCMRLSYQGLSVIAVLVLHPEFEDSYVAEAYFEETGEYLTDLELEYLREYNRYVILDKIEEAV